MRPITTILILTCSVLIALVTASVETDAAQARPPQNLQVLPENWTVAQVTDVMQGIRTALGVTCAHCHVGTPQDRHRDDKPEKLMARAMLKMTMAINSEYMKEFGDPAAPNKVTCFTCHRGELKPPSSPGGGVH